MSYHPIDGPHEREKDRNRVCPVRYCFLTALVILLIILWDTFVIVPAGNRGVVLWWGSVERWNGVLPKVSGGAIPFIELGKMEGLPGVSGAEKK